MACLYNKLKLKDDDTMKTKRLESKQPPYHWSKIKDFHKTNPLQSLTIVINNTGLHMHPIDELIKELQERKRNGASHYTIDGNYQEYVHDAQCEAITVEFAGINN